ncbi:MAG: hypothetical protein ABMA64_01990 [Myxococcota bacterium]
MTAYLRALQGAFGGEFRYRTYAANPTQPGPWQSGAAVLNAATEYGEDLSLASIGAKLWVQGALAVKSTTGVAEAFACIQGYTRGNGKLVVSDKVQLEPDVNASNVSYYPLGSPFAAFGLNGLMFGAVLSGVGGTFTWNVAWREIKADADNPGAWTDLLGASATAGGNGEWNSGNLVVAPGVNGLIEVALKVVATNARATVQMYVAGKYT